VRLLKKNLILNKAILAIIILNAAQIGIIIGIIVIQFFKDTTIFVSFNSETISFIVIILISFLNSFINIKDIHQLGVITSRNDMLQQTLFELEELNKTLRVQRHDFMNHLQVVYGLIELEEFNDTREYIEKVYKDIQSVNRVMRTSSPALNALLQAKVLACEKRGIETKLNITSQFEQIKIPSWELCRIIGNIIDNAIFALNGILEYKYIQIDLYEDIKAHYFCIKNNGPEIPEENKHKIFEPGFTTKGTKGDGMGLAITKETLQNYGGCIEVFSDSEKTVFEGKIPKFDSVS
jgi:sensor histidine kinase regulating citrate/malate metabolism